MNHSKEKIQRKACLDRAESNYLKLKTEEKFYKQLKRKKQAHCLSRVTRKLTAYFLTIMMEARKQEIVSLSAERNNCQTRISICSENVLQKRPYGIPGSPLLRIPHFHRQEPRFDPFLGTTTSILEATRRGWRGGEGWQKAIEDPIQKKRKKKKKLKERILHLLNLIKDI